MPRLDLVFSDLAELDLEEIDLYTYLTWGAEQARTYRGELLRTLEHLLDNPELGHVNEDAGNGVRTITAREHRIHYVVTAGMLRVLRFEGPGQSIDPVDISNLVQ